MYNMSIHFFDGKRKRRNTLSKWGKLKVYYKNHRAISIIRVTESMPSGVRVTSFFFKCVLRTTRRRLREQEKKKEKYLRNLWFGLRRFVVPSRSAFRQPMP